MNIIGTAMIPANLILSVIAVIFSKKSKSFRRIPKKKLKLIAVIFFVLSVALTGTGTAVNYFNGSFPNDFTGAEIAKKCIYVDIFLYLCALEFLPIALVWRTIQQLGIYITIKI